MIFDKKLAQQIQDILVLEDAVKKTDDKFHPKSAEQLEWLLCADGSTAITKEKNGKLIGMALVSNKRIYQAPVETYGFLKFLVGSHCKESASQLPAHPDIFWIECVAVEEDERSQGLSKEMVQQACDFAHDSAHSLPCIIACGIMTTNIAAQNLAARCGFQKIERDWTQDDFADDGSYDRDFAWNIFYKIV